MLGLHSGEKHRDDDDGDVVGDVGDYDDVQDLRQEPGPSWRQLAPPNLAAATIIIIIVITRQ